MKIKKEREETKYRELEKMFDSLDENRKKIYLEKLYAENSFYVNFDKDGISTATKLRIAEMINNEAISNN